MKIKKIVILCFMLIGLSALSANTHPGLFLTPSGLKSVRSTIKRNPEFRQSFEEQKAIADEALTSTIVVPVPKDGGGGYTHEKHKSNYYQMNAAGTLYQITGKKAYAVFVRDMLMKYAELYPTLGLHPAVRSKTPGKIFWQALNEAVWLVHTANAYDCIYDFLSQDERAHLEKNLFRPMAEFISNGNPNNYAVFNMMHNHGTWATAAVGMIAYVMGDKNLVDMALYGSNKDGKSGFIRQMDELFSPDGYFTEGPYYQRYAIWPFMVFAQVIQNKQPELDIFKYRDGVLLKAVDVLINSTYQGEILYLNDALKKTYQTQEIVYAVNIAYKNNPSNTRLLDIARRQETFIISDAGVVTAKALNKKKVPPFQFKSTLLRDGRDGTQGGIAIFRNGEGEEHTCLTFKATSHGLSHGHYDKLSITLHDNGNPILGDYGAVRFLNIEPKHGGHYTAENSSWAKQTIAHNTVTIDQTSHFKADINVSSNYHSEILYSDYSNPALQVVAGRETNAYPGAIMQRTVAMIDEIGLEYPIVLDIFRVQADNAESLDLPFNYQGHMVSTSFAYEKYQEQLQPLGKENGYQHLWLEGRGKSDTRQASFTWYKGNRFYSINTVTNENTEFLFTRLGANDPDFNLRNDPGLIIRQHHSPRHTFVSTVEPHGLYDLNKEVTSGFKTQLTQLELLVDTDEMSAVKFEIEGGKAYLFVCMNAQFDTSAARSISIEGKTISFTGNYYLTELK